jgi:hypothetical protein
MTEPPHAFAFFGILSNSEHLSLCFWPSEKLYLGGFRATVCGAETTPYTKEDITMGDRSPKSMQKTASQNKSKADTAAQKKQQDLAAKSKLAVGKKK